MGVQWNDGQFRDASYLADINDLLPPPASLSQLRHVFLEHLKDATKFGSTEKLESMVIGLGQTRTIAALRGLDRDTRAEAIKELIPLARSNRSFTVRLIEEILNTSASLPEFCQVVSQVGEQNLASIKLDNGQSIFNETLVMARCGLDLKGNEFLRDPHPDRPEEYQELIDYIEEILQHNAQLFQEAANYKECSLPMAMNAEILRNEFQQRKAELLYGVHDVVLDQYDFIKGWNERIRIFAETGLGVYDDERHYLTADELVEIRDGIFSFPANVFLFRGVALRIDFTAAPHGSDRALGGYNLGRVQLFPAMRNAIPGIEFPGEVSAVKYAVVHELSHACHTFCMRDFKRLSGWLAVRNLVVRHPGTGAAIKIDERIWKSCEPITVANQQYLRAEFTEQERFEFGFGENRIVIENPDTPADCGWVYHTDSQFVSEYAAVDPHEDYAESLAHFILLPSILEHRAKSKSDFMGFLYGPIT